MEKRSWKVLKMSLIVLVIIAVIIVVLWAVLVPRISTTPWPMPCLDAVETVKIAEGKGTCWDSVNNELRLQISIGELGKNHRGGFALNDLHVGIYSGLSEEVKLHSFNNFSRYSIVSQEGYVENTAVLPRIGGTGRGYLTTGFQGFVFIAPIVNAENHEDGRQICDVSSSVKIIDCRFVKT